MIKAFINIIFQVKEGLRFTIDSLVMNKLRTFLSLFGITIGIFSIISVFTVLDTLQSFIRTNMNSMGGNAVYIQKFPWGPEEGETEYKWWKYMNRPIQTIKEFEYLSKNLTSSDSVCYFTYIGGLKAQYGKEYINRVDMIGATFNYASMRNTELTDGRPLTTMEIERGQPVALIGADIASELFGNTSPINKSIKVRGHKLKVAGVMKREGNNMFGNSADKWIYVSYKYANNIRDPRYSDPTIMATAKAGYTADELADEINAKMRSYRRLAPKAESTFSTNRLSMVMGMMESIFSTINLAGGLIGMFAIIVGGFGVANIMFVSVRERMGQIGIQKALGAKNYVILLLFLFEAMFLCIIGGLFGLVLVQAGAMVASSIADFPINLTIGNIILGIMVSATVGAVSGFIPAYQAAKMEPVKAIYKI